MDSNFFNHSPENEPFTQPSSGFFGQRQRGFDPRSARPHSRIPSDSGHTGPRRHFGGDDPGAFGRFGGFEGGPGRGRVRMFDAGDLKLVILKLLSEEPSYGYQLIKTMERRLAGGYTPSAGAVYPTLTMLEEEGLAAASTDNNKKVYSVTQEGGKYLDDNKERVEDLLDRIAEAGRGFERERSPEIIKAFVNLRGSVIARASRGELTEEQIEKIVSAINTAAKTIDSF